MSLRRRVETTRAQQFGAELSDGFDHLRSAAVIAAEGAAEAVAPRVDTAREALVPRVHAAREAVVPRVEAARHAAAKSWDTTLHAVSPVVTAAAESARRATEEARKEAGKRGRKAAKAAKQRTAKALGRTPKHRKWPWVLAVIGLGVAAGAVAAVISRRNTPQWEEYEAEHQFVGGTPAEQADEAVEAAKPEPKAEKKPEQSGSSATEKRDDAASRAAEDATNAASRDGKK